MRNLQTDFSMTAPQRPEVVFAALFNKTSAQDAPVFTGGIDYAREKEITKDEMTDEMFAAFHRGDVAMLRGIAGAGKAAEGAAALIAAAEGRREENAPERGADVGPYNDAGLGEVMLFRTGGNVQLARLLLAKMHTNYLMRLDGVMADEMARDMGNFALSEQLRQVQREKAATVEESETLYKSGGIHSRTLGEAFLGGFNGAAEPAAPASTAGSRFLRGCRKKLSGLASIFGFSAARNETPAPLAAQPEETFMGGVMSFVKRFTPSM